MSESKQKRPSKPQRGPQGVYVDEVIHARTARFVENALGGHGTLGGFVAYLEDVLLAAQAEIGVRTDHGALPTSAQGILKRLDQDDALGAYSQYKEAPRGRAEAENAMEHYHAAWAELARFLPWEQDAPETHLFGLFLLRDEGGLWTQDGAFDPFVPANRMLDRFRSLEWAFQHFTRLDAWGGSPERGSPAVAYDSPFFKPFPVTWRGEKFEMIFSDAKSKSTSFYVDPVAHQLAVRAFGRDAFARIERGLYRIFQDSSLWLPLEPEFRFLEHGPALLDYERPIWYAKPTTTLEDPALVHEDSVVELGPSYADTLRGQTLPFADVFPDVRQFGRFSWEAVWYAGEFTDIDDAAAGVTAFHSSLRLAFRLGLADPRADRVDVARLAGEIGPAFLQRFGLSDFAPTHANAYRVIRTYDGAAVETLTTNAVDFHILQLLKAYATSVLPPAEREPSRVAASTLATLAQPWVFPTSETLECYTNTRCVRTEHGIWRLMKGRNSVFELVDEDAYALARALNAIVTTQPSFTPTYEVANALWEEGQHLRSPADRNDHGWRLAKHLEDAALSVGVAGQRLVLSAHPDLAALASDVIHATTTSPSQADPTAMGAVVLAQWMDREAGTGDILFEELAQRLPLDLSGVRLTRRQEEVLLHLLEGTRGHRPRELMRRRSLHGQQVWAYEWSGRWFELEADLPESVARLLNEVFDDVELDARRRIAQAIRAESPDDLGRGIVQMASYLRFFDNAATARPEQAAELKAHLESELAKVDEALVAYTVALDAVRLMKEVGR